MNNFNNKLIFPNLREDEKNYKLNLDILSSLKPLQGKIINLKEQENFLKNLDSNQNREDNYSTSNTMTNLFFEQFFLNENNKKKYIDNYTFNQIPNISTQLGYNTVNYYNSLSNFYPNFFPTNQISNQNIINPYITSNLYYSMNSPYRLMNSENLLLINQLQPLVSIPISQDPIAQISNTNNDEIILEKNNTKINQKKNNYLLKKKRNNETNINIKTNEITNNNNYLDKNKSKLNNSFFVIKQEGNIDELQQANSEKKMFNVYHKSQYIYRRRKRKIKKISNKKLFKFNCYHSGCDGKFKTKKQLVFHHFKMSVECHNDTISLLKMISLVKKLLLRQKEKEKNNKNFEKYSLLYKETMKNIPLVEHIDTIVGFNLED